MFPLFPHRSNQRLLLRVAALGLLLFGQALSIPNAHSTEPLGPNADPLWLRYPALSPDGKTIAFSFQGHLFLVPAEGGLAHPLTAGPAHDTAPVWSRDGKFIAFASDRYGHYDVYLVSIEGGQARRLTTYSNDAIPSTFSPDGKFVVFSGHRRVSAKTSRIPISRFSELYKVSVDGGREPEMILPTPALNSQFDREGQRLIYDDQKSYENLWRKHITSAFAHDIWLFDVRTGSHTKLTTFAGEDRNPVWASDENSFFYLSEQSGSLNVWNLPLKDGQPGTPTQITHFERNPVRFLSGSNAGDLCFGFDGEIYLLPANAENPKKVQIRIATADSSPSQRTVQMSDGATEMALSPNGKEIAFIVRGDVYVASIEHGDTKRITNTPGQERNLCFSPDGRKLVFAFEQNGPWSLYEVSIIQPKEKEPYFFDSTALDIHPILENGQENFSPKYSPDGKEVAYLENRTTLKVLDLDSKQMRTILPGDRNYSYSDGDQWFDWSPDGKFFLVTFLQGGRYSDEVGLISADGKQTITNLTQSGYDSAGPVWTQNGKSMIWLTDRYGLHGDGNGGSTQLDVLEMFFTEDAFDRFNLSPAEYDILKAKEDEEKKKKEGNKEPKPEGAKDQQSPTPEATPKIDPVTIDLKYTEDRTARLTLASTRLAQAVLSKDGEQLVYLARSDKGFDLWSLKPREKELKRLAQFEAAEIEGIGVNFPQQLALDKEGKNAFALVNGHINKVEIASGKMEPIKFASEKEIDAAAERAYFFEHMWRQMKEKFYDPKMHGVDWNYYKGVYARFLPYVADNRDFAEMMSELLGELNASHTGCRYYPRGGDQTAALGAFFDQSYQGPGLKIEEPIEKGPLFKAGVDILPGMIIEKIDGNVIAAGIDVSPLLNFKAGKPTLLGIFDPAKNNRFDVRVKPISLGVEEELLYERWVKKRRELVDKLSNGAVAYVHVRNMTDSSYRDVFSEALGRGVAKKALIVDTRFNPGGNLHDQLATFLDGKAYLKMIPRGQYLGWEPGRKWQRKSVVLGCEGNYSDGMLFPWLYQHFHVGKFIGMPVPGTGTSVWWEFQQDPSLLFGIPQIGRLDEEGHSMETTQVEPDIQVPNDPKSVAEGRDPQIERAVTELMKED
jgi:Tol biopolymer transport system component/C-terminal processing protease CtpA/Prc